MHKIAEALVHPPFFEDTLMQIPCVLLHEAEMAAYETVEKSGWCETAPKIEGHGSVFCMQTRSATDNPCHVKNLNSTRCVQPKQRARCTDCPG